MLTSTKVDIIINNKPITKYNYRGKTYVEGRPGSNYSIQINNRGDIRKKVVISVDGLSIIDGKPASENSPGYIVDAFSTETISGWRTSDSKVARFVFGDKRKSYSNQIGHGTSNVGVIGVLVFDEKTKYIPKLPQYYHPVNPWNSWNSNFSGPMFLSENDDMTSGEVLTASTGTTKRNSLGTGYGNEEVSNVETVEFNSVKTASQTILIYYDTRKGLEARGIVINPAKKIPSAFPASNKYCKAPVRNICE